jgi:hypothetical protein
MISQRRYFLQTAQSSEPCTMSLLQKQLQKNSLVGRLRCSQAVPLARPLLDGQKDKKS